jgi:choline dehydrogenase
MCNVRDQIRDYAAWQDAVGDTGKWSYNDLLPVFMAQEDNDTFHDEYHGIDGGLAVQQPKGINKLNQYCLKAFQEYGISYNPDYNGKSQIGVSQVQVYGRKSAPVQRGRLRPHLASGRDEATIYVLALWPLAGSHLSAITRPPRSSHDCAFQPLRV